jgi:hypothetical protein
MRRRPPVTSADDDYQVGYRRPPVEHRFKPGQSGNLKGRPRKPQDIASVLERALDARVPIQENGRRRIVTMREAIIRGLVNDAARRDQKALRMLFTLLARHQAEALGPKNMGSLAAEDQAILNDFLAEYGASTPGQDRTVTDADSAEQGDQARPSQSDDESS